MKDFKDMKDIIKAEDNKKKNIRIYIAALLAVQVITFSMAGCAASSTGTSASATGYSDSAAVVTLDDDGKTSASKTVSTTNGSLSADDLFTERDLQQTPDLSEAKELTVTSGKSVTISKAGVYHITGSAENCTIIVDAGDEDKVQIVLDGVTVTNTDAPCIYVKNADNGGRSAAGPPAGLPSAGR